MLFQHQIVTETCEKCHSTVNRAYFHNGNSFFLNKGRPILQIALTFISQIHFLTPPAVNFSPIHNPAIMCLTLLLKYLQIIFFAFTYKCYQR